MKIILGHGLNTERMALPVRKVSMDSKRKISADGSNWANIVGAIAAIAAVWGFDFTPEQQASIVTGIVTAQAVINGVLRKYTG